MSSVGKGKRIYFCTNVILSLMYAGRCGGAGPLFLLLAVWVDRGDRGRPAAAASWSGKVGLSPQGGLPVSEPAPPCSAGAACLPATLTVKFFPA